jgi:Mg-chelatase subunit ChlD
VMSSFLSRRHRPARKQFNRQESDSSAVGWISITDCLLLGLGVLVAISFYLQNEKKVAETRLVSSNAALEQEVNRRKLLAEEIESKTFSWLEKLRRLSEKIPVNQREKETLNAAVSMLDQQSEKIKKLEEEKNLAEAKLDALSFQNTVSQKLQQLNYTNTIRGLRKQLSEKRKQEEASEISLRRELVGFKGELQRVAFVIDHSESMTDRWGDAKKTIMNWITALNIEECIVITFRDSHSVIKYPKVEASKSTFTLSGDGKQQSVEKISQVLQETEPKGRTATYHALKRAYEFTGIDTIVLFTDGAPFAGDVYDFNGKRIVRDPNPNEKDNGKNYYDKFLINKTQELCTQNKDIPVNVVGVGDFFDPVFADFLLQLAKISKGSFLGRGD